MIGRARIFAVLSCVELLAGCNLTVRTVGYGTVTSNPAGINCSGSACTATFRRTTVATLTATPAAGEIFLGWVGDCTGTGVCQLSMVAKHRVTARFTPLAPINDTGITFGGEYPTGNNAECSSTNAMISQQDCSQGRDALALAGTLTKVGGGDAGFDFTKLAKDGQPLADQNESWIAYPSGSETSGSQWSCVRDNHTRLWWEMKTDDGGLRDYLWTYTSYDSNYANSDNPTSYSGIADAGSDGVWAGPVDTGPGSPGVYPNDNCGDADKICTTEQYVADVNAAGLCGHHDWRMPTRAELRSIVDFGLVPAVVPDYFAATTVDGYYWSASPYAGDASFARVQSFYGGGDGSGPRSYAGQVRLVRGGQ